MELSESGERARAFVLAQTAPAHPTLVPEISLYLASQVTELWQATESQLEREGLAPPYWAFAWPGGQALARHILDDPSIVRGRSCLDFAAGSGLAAIAAARAGAARAVAAEIDPFAGAAIALNAALNGVCVDIVMDDLLAQPVEAGRFQVILAGDVCYERPMAERARIWLEAQARGGALVLIADPGRAYLPATGLDFLARYAVPTSLELEDRTVRETSVYRFAP
jgi:predicted nicotinamide N-methyase